LYRDRTRLAGAICGATAAERLIFTPQPDLYWKQAIALGAGWEQDR
jgi:hypothetical protein